jgi:hypothetical protein
MDELLKGEATPSFKGHGKPDESLELHLISYIFWNSLEDHAGATRIEPKKNGADSISYQHRFKRSLTLEQIC